MNETFEANPKYNGAHVCPECGAHSYWTCINQSPVIIRVSCDAECGTFESPYTSFHLSSFLDKPVQKLAI